MYLRQPELFDPGLQHVFQSAVHLFGILHLKNDTETLSFHKTLRKHRKHLSDSCVLLSLIPYRCHQQVAVQPRQTRNTDRHHTGRLIATPEGFHLGSNISEQPVHIPGGFSLVSVW